MRTIDSEDLPLRLEDMIEENAFSLSAEIAAVEVIGLQAEARDLLPRLKYNKY